MHQKSQQFDGLSPNKINSNQNTQESQASFQDAFSSCNDNDSLPAGEHSQSRINCWSSSSHYNEKYGFSKKLNLLKNSSSNISDGSPSYFKFNFSGTSERSNSLKRHQIQLEQKRNERNQGIFMMREYRLDRETIIKKISKILSLVLDQFVQKLSQVEVCDSAYVSQASLLFNE